MTQQVYKNDNIIAFTMKNYRGVGDVSPRNNQLLSSPHPMRSRFRPATTYGHCMLEDAAAPGSIVLGEEPER